MLNELETQESGDAAKSQEFHRLAVGLFWARAADNVMMRKTFDLLRNNNS